MSLTSCDFEEVVSQCQDFFLSSRPFFLSLFLSLYMYQFFFKFFSHLGNYRILSRASCAVQQDLVVHFTYSSVYRSIPNSQSIPTFPAHPYNWWVSLFSESVSLFLCCKQVHLNLFCGRGDWIVSWGSICVSAPSWLSPPILCTTGHWVCNRQDLVALQGSENSAQVSEMGFAKPWGAGPWSPAEIIP